MTLEDFKDVYKDKTPLEMLKLLIVQTDYIRDDVRSMERDRINGNEKGADYMRSEIRAKEERIQWLYDQLALVLKAQEPRVVTIADYNDNPNVDKDDNLPVWRESRVFPGIAHHVDGWVVLNRNRVEEWFNSEAIRFWTSRPTEKQREATPWS